MQIAEALADQQDELDVILDGLSDRDWTRPSRCAGWTVADVVLHLAQTNELALGSATGRFAEVANDLLGGSTTAQSIDGAADAMVEREQGSIGADRAGPLAVERLRPPNGVRCRRCTRSGHLGGGAAVDPDAHDHPPGRDLDPHRRRSGGVR